MKILLKISYVGTAYCGYQVQNNGVSIQQRLNEAARLLFGYDCDVVGCSRTDRGVHANSFCACISERGKGGINSTIASHAIPYAFNSYLPGDIAVTDAVYVDDSFHPRYDVKFKEYVYKIHTASISDPFLYGRVWHYGREISEEALGKMNTAASQFIGAHDFSSFMASGSSAKDTVRTVMSASVCKKGDIVEFRVGADGFLYNMVRIMTGTLIGVAQGKISPCDIEKIIEAKDRSLAGVTAPPDGLYLDKVDYGFDVFAKEKK